MSVMIEVPLEILESEHDMETLCPKKLFVYCENEGINRINGNIEKVYQKAKKNGRKSRKNVSEGEWVFIDNHNHEAIKGYFVRMYGWSMDVN